MKQNLRVSLGAVVLALATLAAMIFALLNFDQRTRFEAPDDGVAWLDTDHGVQAWQVAPNSPAARSGIRAGDHLVAINGAPVTSAVQVTKRLWRASLWTQLRYKLTRNGDEFETPLVTAPAEKPASIENYLRVVGLSYLFIGLFIFIRRWNAPRAVHFYVFCLVSFILYSFHYSGKLDTFDYEIYWANIAALVLAPALLLHFALVFPERAEAPRRLLSKLGFVYGPPLVLLLIHVSTAFQALGLPGRVLPHSGNRLLQKLPQRSIRYPTAAIEMAYGWHLRRQPPLHAVLYLPVRFRCGAKLVDEILRAEPGADPALFRLRDHPLPPDGCGHHLQARVGVHRGDRRSGGGLFRGGRANGANISCAGYGPCRRDDCHRHRRVSISAVPRVDPGEARPLLLPRPTRLPTHAD